MPPATARPACSPAAEATNPPINGPKPKPSAIALEPTPKMVAWMMRGVSRPIMAPNAGINEPVTKLLITKVAISRAGVVAMAVPSKVRPISAAAAVVTVR